MRNAFCVHLAVIAAKNCGAGCQTGAPAKGFVKRSKSTLRVPYLVTLPYLQERRKGNIESGRRRAMTLLTLLVLDLSKS